VVAANAASNQMTSCRLVLNVSRNFFFDFENGSDYTPESPAPTVLRRFSSGAPPTVCGLRSAPAQPEIAPDSSPLLQRLSLPQPRRLGRASALDWRGRW
jgi:hypothetical protein